MFLLSTYFNSFSMMFFTYFTVLVGGIIANGNATLHAFVDRLFRMNRAFIASELEPCATDPVPFYCWWFVLIFLFMLALQAGMNLCYRNQYISVGRQEILYDLYGRKGEELDAELTLWHQKEKMRSRYPYWVEAQIQRKELRETKISGEKC